MEEARRELPEGVIYCNDAYETAEGCDALAILTEWNQFRMLDLKRVKELLKAPVLIDLRNIYEPEEAKRHGFTYTCVGRP
jgi:UDPglucose 6-dehydrogenase